MINRQIGRYPISDKLVYTEYTRTINLRTILCHGELHVCQDMSRSAMRAKLRSYRDEVPNQKSVRGGGEHGEAPYALFSTIPWFPMVPRTRGYCPTK